MRKELKEELRASSQHRAANLPTKGFPRDVTQRANHPWDSLKPGKETKQDLRSYQLKSKYNHLYNSAEIVVVFISKSKDKVLCSMVCMGKSCGNGKQCYILTVSKSQPFVS